MGSGGLNKKRKEGFLTILVAAIKKDPTTPIRKLANKLKVHKETVRTAIKQDLSWGLNPFDYAMWGVLENKTNATSYPNIDLLKNTIEKEWLVWCLCFNDISTLFSLFNAKSILLEDQ